MYSKPIQQLIDAFSALPSVGPRTAERFVFHLLKSGKKSAGELTLALKRLTDEVKSCELCFDFSDQSLCSICADSARLSDQLCVVAEAQDIPPLERTKNFRGRYHVLRGTLNVSDENVADLLKIPELFARVKAGAWQEIILALNPDLPGETTMLYLERRLRAINPRLTISRLARGLPMGSDLRYADDITLASALKYRTKT